MSSRWQAGLMAVTSRGVRWRIQTLRKTSMHFKSTVSSLFGILVFPKVSGPVRYEFLIGQLEGHTEIAPITHSWVNSGNPWLHVENLSFSLTPNQTGVPSALPGVISPFEIGYERPVIWGEKGHVPISLHTFLRRFFSTSAPTPAVKNSPADPGARFSAFDLPTGSRSCETGLLSTPTTFPRSMPRAVQPSAPVCISPCARDPQTRRAS